MTYSKWQERLSGNDRIKTLMRIISRNKQLRDLYNYAYARGIYCENEKAWEDALAVVQAKLDSATEEEFLEMVRGGKNND